MSTTVRPHARIAKTAPSLRIEVKFPFERKVLGSAMPKITIRQPKNRIGAIAPRSLRRCAALLPFTETGLGSVVTGFSPAIRVFMPPPPGR
jgi:hypothetical protein